MLLVGDWAPGDKQVVLVHEGSTVLANLEGPVLPLAHSCAAVSKAGPCLFSLAVPDKSQCFVFSLANNHIMDYGLSGLDATLSLLAQKGFRSCGAGKDICDARKPIICRDDDVQLGIIACCEAQFGVARRDSAGVAEFGPWVYRTIRQLRETVEVVIVSVHAAVEDSPWPSPYIRELYRSKVIPKVKTTKRPKEIKLWL
ncbi:MAG: CapA family protein [Chloroflexi bacterium]|nr:CapA family protein [Chloroflexota bacterium]